MRKSLGFLFIIIITTVLNGCILSKSPNTSSVAVTIGEQKTFTLSVFPANATYAWTLDGAPVTGQGKSYQYTAQGGEHSLRVTATHFLGTDKQTWTVFDIYKQEFQIDDIIIGDPSIHYLDPEFIDVNGQHKILFTTVVYDEGPVYVADLNPITGEFISTNGLDILVDDAVAPIYDTFINGPEWAVDQGGFSLVYTKYDHKFNLLNPLGWKQIWRAELQESGITTKTQLTTGKENSIHWAGTLNPVDSSWKFFYGVEQTGLLYWTDENDVNRNNPVPEYVWEGTNNGPRWIAGTPYFVYSKYILNPSKVEIVRVNTLTGEVVVITDDNILKGDVWGFVAPEFNNEICYSTLISPTEIGVYRYLNPGDSFATRIYTISIPKEFDPYHKYISSIEIIQTGSSLLDETYFAFLGADNPTFLQSIPIEPCDGSMWIANLGSVPEARWIRRVDEGRDLPYDPINNMVFRQEPEWLLGTNEAFLYYNAYKEGGKKWLRRCRTGIYLNK